MKLPKPFTLALAVPAVLLVWIMATEQRVDAQQAAPQAKATLTVTVVQPKRHALPSVIPATGDVAAWQEAIVGSDSQGLRLKEVRVDVGDVVRRGQVLAVFDDAVPNAELARQRAALAEAEAAAAAAALDARRVRGLAGGGALSEQQVQQYLTADRAAQARLAAQKAAVELQALRATRTQVLAPDDGVISRRDATVGAVVPAGQELFRLIRRGRLEWRAQVPADDLARIEPGGTARLRAGGAEVQGTVRIVGPSVDPATRNGTVYVMLPASAALKAGMFGVGELDVGSVPAVTLPASAVQLRDGFHVAFEVQPDGRVRRLELEVGRRIGDRVEIRSELAPDARIVASGGAFLADGDTVRVVAKP